MKITRVYADERGESHFADDEVELKDAGSIGRLSAPIPAKHVILRRNDPGYDYDWHVAPNRQFIVLLDGAIEIETQPGRGTRFRVMFPASGRREVALAAAAADTADWKAQGTVLVIDDDEGVRDLVGETLERAGLRVLHAPDAATGVDRFARHADAIDLVILDCSLPAARGEEPFDAIRRLSPGARVLLLSGYSEERAAAPLAGRGLAGFLQKPFLPERLLERVRAALGR